MPLPRFILLNGPPGSGKSTLSRLICDIHRNAAPDSFAQPIRDALYATFFPEEGPILYNIDMKSPSTKDMDFPYQHPDAKQILTYRQVMIGFAEQWLRPTFGRDIFGRLLFQRCVEQEMYYDSFVVDDAGFPEESGYIAKMAHPSNCALIRLHRKGCSFAKDSRNYITLEGVPTLDLENDTSPEALYDDFALAFKLPLISTSPNLKVI